MKMGFVGIAAATMVIGTAQAAEPRGTRFWNLTGDTIVHLSLAPAGSRDWGADQCLNDPDHSVDFDERLRITGVSTGRYDVRLTDRTGRTCVVTDVHVTAGAIFEIDHEALANCRPP